MGLQLGLIGAIIDRPIAERSLLMMWLHVLCGRYGVPAYFGSKVVAEAPISAAISALGGACLYPLVNLQPGADKFGKFVLTLVLEGFASGALGLLLGAVAPTTDTALAMFRKALASALDSHAFSHAFSRLISRFLAPNLPSSPIFSQLRSSC